MAKAKKLPSSSYRVLIYDGKDENGKRQYKSFTAPEKAQAEFLASEYRVKRKTQAKAGTEDLTLSQTMEKYIDAKENILSPSTVEGYRSAAKIRFINLQKLKLSELTSALV